MLLVEMELLLFLLGFSFALGYEEPYEGFGECGTDGWSCGHVQGKYEITYRCPEHRPSARVWVWTARLPTGATTFTVRDCNHLEVHFDCTTGLRATILRQFKVINVTHLEILPPLLPEVFLHDNDQVPQAPPVLYLSNVKKIKYYPGVFDKAAGNCRYKFIEITSLTLENVYVDKIMKDLFYNKNMKSLVMKNVVINSIDSNAMTIAADALISGTTFPVLPSNAIALRGENISFVNNTFRKIQSFGLTVKCKDFVFAHNHIQEVASQGLDVLGAKILITKNKFDHLETGALQKIKPGYSPLTFEIASKFTYQFTGNLIKNINPGSIHPDWEVFKKVCSEIEFKNNIFDCSCINLGWLSVANGLGPQIYKVKEFYDNYLTKDINECIGYNSCPLKNVIAQIQDVCNNKTNVSIICSSAVDVAQNNIATSPDDLMIDLSLGETTEEETFVTKWNEATEKVISVLSYTENQTLHNQTRGLPILFVVFPVIFILAAICIGIFIWWYKKKKQRQTVTTLYKNEKSADADNLIVINEHHNQLYDKQ